MLQPVRAWSVVARGAVIAVLRNTFSGEEYKASMDAKMSNLLLRMPEVAARISRLNYGIESGVPVSRVSPPMDRSLDRVTRDPDGTELVWRMKWYLKQVSDTRLLSSRLVFQSLEDFQGLTAFRVSR